MLSAFRQFCSTRVSFESRYGTDTSRLVPLDRACSAWTTLLSQAYLPSAASDLFIAVDSARVALLPVLLSEYLSLPAKSQSSSLAGLRCRPAWLRQNSTRVCEREDRSLCAVERLKRWVSARLSSRMNSSMQLTRISVRPSMFTRPDRSSLILSSSRFGSSQRSATMIMSRSRSL